MKWPYKTDVDIEPSWSLFFNRTTLVPSRGHDTVERNEAIEVPTAARNAGKSEGAGSKESQVGKCRVGYSVG